MSNDIANADFEALLNQYDYKFKKGDIVKGTVYSYEANGVSVDIGAKNVAYVPNYEISTQKGIAPEEILKQGEEYEFLIISLALKTVYDFLNEVHSAMGPLLKHLLKLIKCAFPLRSAAESKQILNSITSQLNTFSKQLVLEDSTQTADLRVFNAECGEKYKLIVAYLLNSSCGNRIIQI